MKILMMLVCLLWPLSAFAIDYPDLNKYYPLAEGNKWVYDVQISTREDVVEKSEPENNYYVISTTSALGKAYHSVRQIGDRIVRVAHQNALTGEIENDINYKILVAPFKKGLKWVNLLDQGYSEDYRFIGFVTTECKAGKFKDVAKFEHITHSPKSKDMVEYEYYAPNVGLIKKEYKLSKKVITGVDLVEYKINNNNAKKEPVQ